MSVSRRWGSGRSCVYQISGVKQRDWYYDGYREVENTAPERRRSFSWLHRCSNPEKRRSASQNPRYEWYGVGRYGTRSGWRRLSPGSRSSGKILQLGWAILFGDLLIGPMSSLVLFSWYSNLRSEWLLGTRLSWEKYDSPRIAPQMMESLISILRQIIRAYRFFGRIHNGFIEVSHLEWRIEHGCSKKFVGNRCRK